MNTILWQLKLFVKKIASSRSILKAESLQEKMSRTIFKNLTLLPLLLKSNTLKTLKLQHVLLRNMKKPHLANSLIF